MYMYMHICIHMYICNIFIYVHITLYKYTYMYIHVCIDIYTFKCGAIWALLPSAIQSRSLCNRLLVPDESGATHNKSK